MISEASVSRVGERFSLKGVFDVESYCEDGRQVGFEVEFSHTDVHVDIVCSMEDERFHKLVHRDDFLGLHQKGGDVQVYGRKFTDDGHPWWLKFDWLNLGNVMFECEEVADDFVRVLRGLFLFVQSI
jgi:hypothetical protein